MNIFSLLNKCVEILKNNGIENPVYESELLISHFLNIERYKIYTEKIEIKENFVKKILKLIDKRVRGYPLQYLIKKAYFFDIEFKIVEGVFIPRPETELLVEEVICLYKKYFYPKKIKILDIGTGCGNIGISLALNIENCFVKGVDISKKALKIARENAILNNVKNKVKFFYSNIFSNINEKFEIITSNPPYISEKDYAKLDREVKKEPKRSLYGGKDGLKVIRKIIKECKHYMKKNGFLVLEIGYNQTKKIKEFIPDELEIVKVKKDFSEIERVLVFKKK